MPIISNKVNGDVTVRATVNTTLTLNGPTGTSLAKQYGELNSNGTISVNASSTAVTGTNTQFTRLFSAGDAIFIQSNSTYSETIVIQSVTNDTEMVLASNSTNTNTAAQFAQAERVEFADISGLWWSVTSNSLTTAGAHILRGSNTVMNLYQNGTYPGADGPRVSITDDNGGTVVINLDGPGTVIATISKKVRISKSILEV